MKIAILPYLGAWVAGHGVDRAAPARHPSSTPSNHSHQMPNWLSRPLSHFSLCFLTCSKLNIKPFSHHSLSSVSLSNFLLMQGKPLIYSHKAIFDSVQLPNFVFAFCNFLTFYRITTSCETDQLDQGSYDIVLK